mmetsp:Transcript_18707/g.27072  ORF Transcript_18707/g.27072 Transcript_18707/m.27072 type:complete len:277 (-) Transcript_18707:376-1206(-)
MSCRMKLFVSVLLLLHGVTANGNAGVQQQTLDKAVDAYSQFFGTPNEEEGPNKVGHYRVVGSAGCSIRKTPDLDSELVTKLDAGSYIETGSLIGSGYSSHPLVKSGRRVRVVSPARGFTSVTSASGYRILAPSDAPPKLPGSVRESLYQAAVQAGEAFKAEELEEGLWVTKRYPGRPRKIQPRQRFLRLLSTPDGKMLSLTRKESLAGQDIQKAVKLKAIRSLENGDVDLKDGDEDYSKVVSFTTEDDYIMSIKFDTAKNARMFLQLMRHQMHFLN